MFFSMHAAVRVQVPPPHKRRPMRCVWQVEEMLRFFTSVRLLMWVDSPSLRQLVIVEAQWLVDGVGRVIRDHAGIHADKQMAMRAREEFMVKEFEQLTRGDALLTRELCDKVLSLPSH